jgi:hypothetical protein
VICAVDLDPMTRREALEIRDEGRMVGATVEIRRCAQVVDLVHVVFPDDE